MSKPRPLGPRSGEARSRRTLRDLVGLTTLPAIWAGHKPLQVAASLAEVLQKTLRLQIIYIRLGGRSDLRTFEVARTARRPLAAADAAEVGRALAPWFKPSRVDLPSTLKNPLGSGTVRIVGVPIGRKEDEWALVAGSRRASFPTEEERMLLGVGANQAAMVLQCQRAEETHRQLHSRMELAVRGSDIGIWELDMPDGVFRNGRVDFTNVLELLGYDRTELAPDFAARMTLVHHEDQARLEEAVDAYLSGRTPDLEIEHRARHSDGTCRWMLTRGVAIRDEAGVPVRMVGSCIDITRQKRSEQALRESEERMAADLAGMKRLQELSTRLVHDGDAAGLLEDIVDAAIAITAADMGNIQLLDRATRTLKFVASRGLGREYLDHFGAIHDGQTSCGAAMIRGERVVIGDVAASVFRGRDLDVMLAAGARAIQSTPLIGRSGQLVGMLSTHYREPRAPAERDLGMLDLLARQAADWIERTEWAEALRLAKEGAEAANRAKDEFLANVSHEIRNPFGAMLGMTELVLETELTDEQRQCLRTAKSAAESLLGLVNDVLDYEKIEAGKLAFDPTDFSLRATVDGSVRTLAVRARDKGLELSCDVGPDVPDALIGDPVRLRQVLVNLIGNAIKFTMQGRVAVRVECDGGPGPEEDAVLRFAIVDTGIGVPAEGRERIFRAFEQWDSSSTRRFGGTGLGLTIATRLVGLMGGDIGVESEPGRGSTFTFTARFGQPAHRTDRVDEHPPGPIDVGGPAAGMPALRVLVAEDSEFNARHLERLLARRGHAVRMAGNGREALDLVGREDFDVLLLDVHMPELDGFHVVRAIREGDPGRHLPVIALTARAGKKDRDRCLSAGMDDYLSKPVRSAELFATIDRVLAAPGVPPRTGPPDRDGLADLLDPVAVLDACGGDAIGLVQIREDFRTYAPARLTELGDALRDGDTARLGEAAHMLGGLLGAFSSVAGRVASDLEHAADRRRLGDAVPLVERLLAMARELDRQMDDVSIQCLRRRAGTRRS